MSNVNTLVDRAVGSTLPDGAIAALNYAYRLVTLPHGLLVVAVLQKLYPALGAAAGDREAFSRLTTRGTTTLVGLLVPLAAVLVVLAEPVVAVVYGRGSFSARDAARTAAALAAYAPGLVALGVRDVALRGLYGLADRWRPALVAAAGMAVNVVGDLALGPRFGVVGLGAATSMSFAASAALGVGLLARVHGGVGVGQAVAALGRGALAVLPAGLVMAGLAGVLPGTGTAAALLRVVVAGGAGVAVHLLVLRLLRAPEVTELGALGGSLLRRVRSR